jgi:hypothetical protein
LTTSTAALAASFVEWTGSLLSRYEKLKAKTELQRGTFFSAWRTRQLRPGAPALIEN